MIAVIGEALIDMHVEGDLLRPFAGGGPFNTAIQLGRLDTPACFLGALSFDRFGRQLEQALRSAGVDTSGVRRVDAPSPIAIVDSASVEPSYSFYLAGTAHEALQPADFAELPAHVVALHVGTLALATDPPAPAIAEFAEREAELRTLVIDPNIRAAMIPDRAAYLTRFERLARNAGLVKLSAGDLSWLYPDRLPADAARGLLGGGAACVAITHGSDGAEAWTHSGTARIPAPDVTVVDTVGAGDAFGAGLLAWLWRSNELTVEALRSLGQGELEAALRYAAAVAAAQCSRASAWGPAAADVDRFLDTAGPTSRPAREENDGLARVR